MHRQELHSKILNYKTISFDLFDTLIERCFYTPSDLFFYIESIENAPGFASARILVEKNFYNQKKNSDYVRYEVTYDEIYTLIDKKYQYLKQKELHHESNAITATQAGRDLFWHAFNHGKEIIITSDTYHDELFIQRLINNLGYTGYKHLLVSSAKNKTKRNGNLFNLVSDLVQHDRSEVLHIGDNLHADVAIPQTFGFHCAPYVEPSRSNYITQGRRYRKQFDPTYLDANSRAKRSILMALSSRYPLEIQQKGFWDSIGFYFAGPMIVDFVQWIIDYANDINADHVMFLARDGHFLEQAFSELAFTPKHTYYPLTRAVVQQLESDECKRAEFLDHVKALGLDKQKILMVDVGSVNFSAQTFLSGIGLNIHGAYWIVGGHNKNLSYRTYFEETASIDEESDIFRASGIVELFMSAPLPPIIGVSCSNGVFEPIHQTELNNHELLRIEILKSVEKGFNAFLALYQEKAGRTQPRFGAKEIIHWTNLLLHTPTTKEKNYLRKVYHASNDQHNHYSKQFKFLDFDLFKQFHSLMKEIINVR